MFPFSLSQMLESKTCIILGAGASADFSMPLWSELRTLLVDHMELKHSDSSERTHWLNVLLNSPDAATATVDELAMEATNEQEFNFFQRCLSEILLERESKAHIEDNWVSVFANAVGRRLLENEAKSLGYVSNLSVVSLNYDRCFNHYFSVGIKKVLSEKYKRPRITDGHYDVLGEKIENVLHPHGCLGQLNSKKYIRNKLEMTVPRNEIYDKVIEFGGKIMGNHIPPIFPVDEMHLPRFSNNRIYLESNIAIRNAKYCICIGLSPLGLEHSLLAFEKNKEVYYSGSEKIFPGFIPLNTRASELIGELIS